MYEKLQITRDNGRLQAMTWDRYGGMIDVQLSEADEEQLNAIMDKAKDARPQWERDLEGAQIVANNALQDKQQAVEAKQKAEVAQGKAEQQAEAAEAARTQAVAARQVAEQKAETLEAQYKEANNKITWLLTGGLTDQATTDLIMLYPELTEADYGRSIDAGEAYRVGTILYIATRNIDGLTVDKMPSGAEAATYWRGGAIKHQEPTPTPGFKYPAGSEAEYQGVMYYATKDTNSGPEVGYPVWDLLENKPKV